MTAKTVLILADVHESVVNYLTSKGYTAVLASSTESDEFQKYLTNTVGIIYRFFSTTFSTEILQKATSLRCIVRTGGGRSAMDTDLILEKGIKIMHTSGCNSDTAAEFIFSSIMTLSKKISEGNLVFRAGKNDRSELWGHRIAKKTLGIIGFGRMGKTLSKMAHAFDMRIIAYSPNITTLEEKEYDVTSVSLETLYKESDFISIAFPVRVEHKGMFDAAAFDMMKSGVNLINMTWMGLFDEDALVSALKSGKIGGVMIERPSFDSAITTSPLMDFDNVIFTPALGSHSHEGQGKCAKMAADLLIDYLENGVVNNEIKISLM